MWLVSLPGSIPGFCLENNLFPHAVSFRGTVGGSQLASSGEVNLSYSTLQLFLHLSKTVSYSLKSTVSKQTENVILLLRDSVFLGLF